MLRSSITLVLLAIFQVVQAQESPTSLPQRSYTTAPIGQQESPTIEGRPSKQRP